MMNDATIIEGIDALSFKVRVRDRVTDDVHELELHGHGPWDLSQIEKVIAGKGSSSKRRILPPPDDEITLKLDNREGKGVRVGATGSGAKAWTASQGTLLGARWFLDARGAPVVLLEDSPSIVADIENALPKVTVDTTHYVDRPVESTVVVVAKTPRERKERSKKLTAAPAAADKPPRKPPSEPVPTTADTPAPSAPAARSVETPEAASGPAAEKPSRARAEARRRSRRHEQLTPGLGAGNLTWEESGDGDNPGLVAPWKDGRFKILHAGGDVYALFYEYDRDGKAGYDRIACGPVDTLKVAAGERTVTEFRPVDLEAARRACGVAEPQATPPKAKAEPAKPEPPPAGSPKPESSPDGSPAGEPADDAEGNKQAMDALKKLLEDTT